jgi:hypothetical protein
VTKIILVRWVIGSFGVCLCVGLCEGANPKCANAGWLKLFFKMCGGKIFKTLRWVSVGKMVWSVSSYSEIVNEFLSPENLFGSQKSGRFGVRLIVRTLSCVVCIFSISIIQIFVVYNLSGCLFTMTANGRVYETFGITKRFPIKLQLLLIRAETLDKPLSAKCFIHVVVHWCSVFLSNFPFNLLLRFCLPCVWVGKLFG